MKEEKEEEEERSTQTQRGPRDLLEGWYPKADPHIPFLLWGEHGATPG